MVGRRRQGTQPVLAARSRPLAMSVSGPLDRARVPLADPFALDAPRNDALGVDADDRRWSGDRLGGTPELDPARSPRFDAHEVVDDDGGASGREDGAVLLRLLEAEAADLDH